MNIKKLPGTISNEDLLRVLENPEDTSILEKPTEHSALQFLADFGIYPGKELVSGRLLYKVYYYHTEDPISTLQFNLILTSYLKYELRGANRDYLLNKDALLFTNKLAEYLVEKNKNKKVKNWFFRKHFETFMKASTLKKGTTSVPVGFLYFFYDNWHYANKLTHRLTFRNFTAVCKLYFKTKRTAKIWTNVYISKDFLNQFTQETIKTALEWSEKFNAKEKKKERRGKTKE
jgi:hypothetical protein